MSSPSCVRTVPGLPEMLTPEELIAFWGDPRVGPPTTRTFWRIGLASKLHARLGYRGALFTVRAAHDVADLYQDRLWFDPFGTSMNWVLGMRSQADLLFNVEYFRDYTQAQLDLYNAPLGEGRDLALELKVRRDRAWEAAGWELRGVPADEAAVLAALGGVVNRCVSSDT